MLPFVFLAGWFVWELSPPGDAGATVNVEIQPGWGAKEAGDALQAHGVIGSSLAFQIWAKVSGTNFQAGVYELNENLGVREAAAALRRGPGAASHLTLALPPGLTLNQIADRVGQLPGHNRDSFLQTAASGAVRSTLQPPGTTSLEGLTWPDTYFIGEQQTDEDILRTIVTAFDEHAAAAGVTSYDTVKIASLIQAESTAEDAPLVVGGHRQPAPTRDAAPDRRHALLREGRVPAGAEQRRQADRLSLQHLQGLRVASHADHDGDRTRPPCRGTSCRRGATCST